MEGLNPVAGLIVLVGMGALLFPHTTPAAGWRRGSKGTLWVVRVLGAIAVVVGVIGFFNT